MLSSCLVFCIFCVACSTFTSLTLHTVHPKIAFPTTFICDNAQVSHTSDLAVCLHSHISLGARLKPNVVPAKLFQCSRLSGRNKKSSKFICPPTKPTRTWWQNMLFASLGGPRRYAHICCPARCHVKKTCFQKQFLLEHDWNTAGTSYWNVAGTSTLQQEQSTRKGKMVTYIVV